MWDARLLVSARKGEATREGAGEADAPSRRAATPGPPRAPGQARLQNQCPGPTPTTTPEPEAVTHSAAPCVLWRVHRHIIPRDKKLTADGQRALRGLGLPIIPIFLPGLPCFTETFPFWGWSGAAINTARCEWRQENHPAAS